MAETKTADSSTPCPDRREQIARAALRVIGRHGVNALTHRNIAAEAKVALGHTTYYFAKLDDIIEYAFDLAMADDMRDLAAWVQSLGADCDLPRELTRLVMRRASLEKESSLTNFELVLAAVHRPHLQPKAHAWSTFLARILRPHLSQDTAECVAVTYDGALLRQTMTGSIGGAAEVESSFRRACGDDWHFPSRDDGPAP